MKVFFEYIFILGRYPELSLQEIASVLRMRKISYTTICTAKHFLILRTHEKLPINEINKSLGGTVKIGKITQHISLEASGEALENYLTSDRLFIDILDDIQEKLTFGISVYAEDETRERQSARTLVPPFLTKIKDHLEAQGFKVRFPRHEGPALSSASVEKNKLLKTGAEILLVLTKDELLVGKTLAVQEFESFSQRDFGRPARDMDSGIMPPKIARMMINLAEQPVTSTLLDPFCGSGTILQEALLLGYKNLIGNDISRKAVEDTKNNMKWMSLQYEIPSSPEVFECDVIQLMSKLSAKVDAIVTEPYMGPNFQANPTIQEVRTNKDKLEKLYLNAWTSFADLLKPGGIAVMILPIFRVKNQYLKIDMLTQISSLGFEQVELSAKLRHSLIIGNRFDFVLREIVKFHKV